MTWQKDAFTIDTDKSKLNIPYIHNYLSTESYWAENIPYDVVERSINGSMCFGIYHNSDQIGLARMITDNATFAYMADVFIDKQFRGRGLSKWLMEVMLAHPNLQGLRSMMLATRDAHELYKKFGFVPISNPERFMRLPNPDVYKKISTE